MENEDFRSFSKVLEDGDFEAAEISVPSGQGKKEHMIKLDTAKEMEMLERNAKGRHVRWYLQMRILRKSGK